MKTRKAVMKEILTLHRRHSLAQQHATLEYALDSMPDTALFQLAEELDINLETGPEMPIYDERVRS